MSGHTPGPASQLLYRLIHSAPDLLRALEEIDRLTEEWLAGMHGGGDEIQRIGEVARAAIAKARGGGA